MSLINNSVNWVEVDLDAILYNLNGLRKKLPSQTKVCMVVKSNAYGHGSAKLAKFYEENGVDFLAVARAREAFEIRKAGVTIPILNLGYTNLPTVEDCIKNNVSMTIFDYEYAKKINDIAKKINKTAKIHLKMDTGMSRLGYVVLEEDIDHIVLEIEKISKLEYIEIEGMYTHFATADARTKEVEELQTGRFAKMVEALENKGLRPPYVHSSNSAEILDMEEKYDMVRMGIVQYGLYPSDEVSRSVDLKPAMSFKAKVSNIKILNPGTSISYGRIYFTTVKERIATITVGYADGFLRGRRNPYVFINGIKCPIVGRICMDQCMVRVPMDMDIKIDDDVLIFGSEHVTVDDIAHDCDTINYEVLCQVSRRVPRVYIQDGKIVDIVDYLLD